MPVRHINVATRSRDTAEIRTTRSNLGVGVQKQHPVIVITFESANDQRHFQPGGLRRGNRPWQVYTHIVKPPAIGKLPVAANARPPCPPIAIYREGKNQYLAFGIAIGRHEHSLLSQRLRWRHNGVILNIIRSVKGITLD
jgi:hypothetical protein